MTDKHDLPARQAGESPGSRGPRRRTINGRRLGVVAAAALVLASAAGPSAGSRVTGRRW